jgi:hypothetical protein
MKTRGSSAVAGFFNFLKKVVGDTRLELVTSAM